MRMTLLIFSQFGQKSDFSVRNNLFGQLSDNADHPVESYIVNSKTQTLQKIFQIFFQICQSQYIFLDDVICRLPIII